MKKILLSLIAAMFLVSPVYAGKLTVGATNLGQYTDTKVSGANATYTKINGNEATIDLSQLSQTSTALTTTPVLTLTQAATIAPAFAVSCTSGGGFANDSTCGTYTSTVGTKQGSIKIYINGLPKYIAFTGSPA